MARVLMCAFTVTSPKSGPLLHVPAHLLPSGEGSGMRAEHCHPILQCSVGQRTVARALFYADYCSSFLGLNLSVGLLVLDAVSVAGSAASEVEAAEIPSMRTATGEGLVPAVCGWAADPSLVP